MPDNVTSDASGFVTVITPFTCQLPGVPSSWLTLTVYSKVAVPPAAMLCELAPADLAIFHAYVCVYDGRASLLTVGARAVSPAAT